MIVEVADGELRIRSRNAALANARRMMRQFVPDGVSFVDDLIAERPAEGSGVASWPMEVDLLIELLR